jgi:hypothetical protein
MCLLASSSLAKEGGVAAKQRLGLRQVRALKPGQIVWDPFLPGFGARRQRSEAVSYILFYRTRVALNAATIGGKGARLF